MINKKGIYADVFIFIIMAFIITVFFGIMYYGFGVMNNAFGTVDFSIGNTTFQSIVDSTWGEVYASYSQLKTLSYVLIFGMILTIFTSAWVVRRPPIFLVIWVITSLVGVIASVYISNAYQLLLLNDTFGATLQSFTGASYMLIYLPYLSAIICLFSGLISLVGFNRGAREEVTM